MLTYRKSPVVADVLGITYSQLSNLIRSKKLAPPARDSSGDYVWTDADLDRARAALAAGRRRQPAEAVHV